MTGLGPSPSGPGLYMSRGGGGKLLEDPRRTRQFVVKPPMIKGVISLSLSLGIYAYIHVHEGMCAHETKRWKRGKQTSGRAGYELGLSKSP